MRLFPFSHTICRYPALGFRCVDLVVATISDIRVQIRCWEHVGFSFIFCTVICIILYIVVPVSHLHISFDHVLDVFMLLGADWWVHCPIEVVKASIDVSFIFAFHFGCMSIFGWMYVSIYVILWPLLLIPAECRGVRGMDGLVGEHDHFGWGSVKRIHHVRFFEFFLTKVNNLN